MATPAAVVAIDDRIPWPAGCGAATAVGGCDTGTGWRCCTGWAGARDGADRTGDARIGDDLRCRGMLDLILSGLIINKRGW